MQPDPTKVSGQSGDSGELPTPTFSDQATSSTSSGDVDAIVNKLTPILESLVEKRVQSTKDKRFNQIEKILGGRLDVLAELESQGVAIPPEVRTRMEINDLRDQMTTPTQPNQPAPVRDDGSSQQRAAVAEAIAELAKYSLSPNEAAFMDVLRGQYRDRASFDLAVNKYILGRVVQPTQPASPATIVQPASTATSRPTLVTPESLTEEYNKRVGPLRGNIKAVSALQAEIRKKAGEAGFKVNI